MILYRRQLVRSLVVDGNFTADHLRQRRAEDDVLLMEGQGMMTSHQPFSNHLAVAKETVEVQSCL